MRYMKIIFFTRNLRGGYEIEIIRKEMYVRSLKRMIQK